MKFMTVALGSYKGVHIEVEEIWGVRSAYSFGKWRPMVWTVLWPLGNRLAAWPGSAKAI